MKVLAFLMFCLLLSTPLWAGDLNPRGSGGRPIHQGCTP